jgi:hypothetical protein
MLLTLIAAPQGGFAHDSPLEEAVCCELVSKVKKSREELGSRFPGGFWMIPEP